MSNIGSTISHLLKQARDADATPDQVAQLRREFRIQFGWNPTKRQPSPEQRKTRRAMQKASRKANRGKTKGISNRQGQMKK